MNCRVELSVCLNFCNVYEIRPGNVSKVLAGFIFHLSARDFEMK